MKTKKNLEPGTRYRGWGWVNEYGEFEFSPEDTGARVGQVKVVTEGNKFKVSESKKFVLIHAKIDKTGKPLDRIQSWLQIVKDVIDILKTYDF